MTTNHVEKVKQAPKSRGPASPGGRGRGRGGGRGRRGAPSGPRPDGAAVAAAQVDPELLAPVGPASSKRVASPDGGPARMAPLAGMMGRGRGPPREKKPGPIAVRVKYGTVIAPVVADHPLYHACGLAGGIEVSPDPAPREIISSSILGFRDGPSSAEISGSAFRRCRGLGIAGPAVEVALIEGAIARFPFAVSSASTAPFGKLSEKMDGMSALAAVGDNGESLGFASAARSWYSRTRFPVDSQAVIRGEIIIIDSKPIFFAFGAFFADGEDALVFDLGYWRDASDTVLGERVAALLNGACLSSSPLIADVRCATVIGYPIEDGLVCFDKAAPFWVVASEGVVGLSGAQLIKAKTTSSGAYASLPFANLQPVNARQDSWNLALTILAGLGTARIIRNRGAPPTGEVATAFDRGLPITFREGAGGDPVAVDSSNAFLTCLFSAFRPVRPRRLAGPAAAFGMDATLEVDGTHYHYTPVRDASVLAAVASPFAYCMYALAGIPKPPIETGAHAHYQIFKHGFGQAGVGIAEQGLIFGSTGPAPPCFISTVRLVGGSQFKGHMWYLDCRTQCSGKYLGEEWVQICASGRYALGSIGSNPKSQRQDAGAPTPVRIPSPPLGLGPGVFACGEIEGMQIFVPVGVGHLDLELRQLAQGAETPLVEHAQRGTLRRGQNGALYTSGAIVAAAVLRAIRVYDFTDQATSIVTHNGGHTSAILSVASYIGAEATPVVAS